MIRTAATFVLLMTSVAFAQERPAPVTTATSAPSSAPTTQPHRATLVASDGKTYAYTARPDFLVTRDEEGKPRARFFHTYYSLDGADAATRPITFVFNGGPGSSSVWLHLGAVGPKRVVIGDDALPPAPPGKLADNPHSWFPASDLVFIDPIGTGFSRAEPGVDARSFYSPEGDVASIGEFIRLFLSKHRRWSSPKYLAGESYGTTRAAFLSNHLSRSLGIDLSGIVLVSSVLEFSTIRGDEGNDLPFVLFMPSYSATAYHHRKLPAAQQARKLEDVLADAEAFALGDYARALAGGATLSVERRRAIADRYAELTGLPAEWVFRNNLRVSPSRFFKRILEAEGKVVGRFDSTLTAFDADHGAATPEFDPSYTAYQGAYTSALNQLLTGDFRFETDAKYEILAGLPWTYPQGVYLNVAGQLADAMTTNPHLRVLVASGYHDLATPYFATAYTLNRLNLSPEARARLVSRHYFGGHMMYHYPESRKELARDAIKFLQGESR